jgi:hypothetical protein
MIETSRRMGSSRTISLRGGRIAGSRAAFRFAHKSAGKSTDLGHFG